MRTDSSGKQWNVGGDGTKCILALSFVNVQNRRETVVHTAEMINFVYDGVLRTRSHRRGCTSDEV